MEPLQLWGGDDVTCKFEFLIQNKQTLVSHCRCNEHGHKATECRQRLHITRNLDIWHLTLNYLKNRNSFLISLKGWNIAMEYCNCSFSLCLKLFPDTIAHCVKVATQRGVIVKGPKMIKYFLFIAFQGNGHLLGFGGSRCLPGWFGALFPEDFLNIHLYYSFRNHTTLLVEYYLFLLRPYLRFVISFTRAKFLENEIYTEKHVNYKKWI